MVPLTAPLITAPVAHGQPHAVAMAALLALKGSPPCLLERRLRSSACSASSRGSGSQLAAPARPRLQRRRWQRPDDERLLSMASLGPSSSGSDSSSEGASSSSEDRGSDESGAVQIDLQLPRRSKLVAFTCDKCGEPGLLGTSHLHATLLHAAAWSMARTC